MYIRNFFQPQTPKYMTSTASESIIVGNTPILKDPCEAVIVYFDKAVVMYLVTIKNIGASFKSCFVTLLIHDHIFLA